MISIPLMNHKSTAENRPKYLAWLRAAGAERVFVCPGNPYGDTEKLAEIQKQLAENIAYYTENGLQVGVWINGLGHGGMLSHEVNARVGSYTRIRGLGNGGEADDSFCPLDPEFVAMYRNYIRVLAGAGAKMIQIDDDLRIAMHGPVAIGCACPLHIAELNRRAAEAGLAKCDYTREELAAELFTGKPTPIRKIWLDLQGDTLKNFAAALREELDSIDPTIRLGHCSCLSTWDTDGVDSITLSRIFAGSTRPFLRLIGAAYWTNGRSFGTTGLGSIIDLERMQFAWCKEMAPEIELMSEGDVYPRPRYKTPSSYLEGFHQAFIANGTPDILKYMLDYTYDPDYETGYIRRHNHTKILRDSIADSFADTEPAGIYVYEAMRKLENMDCTGIPEGQLAYRLTPIAANFTGALSLPISFEKSRFTEAAMIVGENARYAPAEVCEMPLILDTLAARILTERGFDVGLTGCESMEAPTNETFADGQTMPVECGGRFWRLTPAGGAETDSFFNNGAPAMYRYTRDNGTPVIVYAFDMETISTDAALVKNYCRQEQLLRMLPVKLVEIRKEPGAYVITRKTEDSMTVGIWNFGNDMLLPEKILLDDRYSVILPIGKTDAVLEEDTVVLRDMVPPYCFAGFVVKK
ncbi:MAG: hypothetical protein IKY52_09265 [Clostridia bacterium]|nr:hypothetical protein [Clostridia bacterium]